VRHFVPLFVIIVILASMVAPMVQAQEQGKLPSVPVNEGWVVVDKFGGMNTYFPADKLPPEVGQNVTNFLPYGIYWLGKRSGYRKIYFTQKGSVYGLAVADSVNSKSRLVVVGDDDLYFTDSDYDWELQDFGNTTAEATYFTSTPFGLVISNDGSDSTRLWDGISTTSIKALGICEAGTGDSALTISSDTLRLIDNSQAWASDEWIGYWLLETGADSIFKIIDNWVCSLDYVMLGNNDTVGEGSAYSIVSRPDSCHVWSQRNDSALVFPRGQATAYCYDRLFVSSKKYPWRIWYSQVRLVNCIDIDAFINLDMDAHDKIQAMRVFNNHLIVFGEHSTYGVDNSLVAYPISKAVGCAAPKTIAVGDDYIYFLSHRGLYRFKGNMYGSFSYNFQKISDPITGSIDAIDASNLPNCGGMYTDKQYWFSHHPDSCWVFDERTEQWYRQTFGFSDGLASKGAFYDVWNEYLVPNTDDGTNEWTPSTASDHHELIDEVDVITTYLSTTVSDEEEHWGMTNTTQFLTGGTVDRVSITVCGKSGYPWNEPDLHLFVSANPTGAPDSRDTSSLGMLSDFPTSWTSKTLDATTNPVTGAAWTKGDLDSLILAVRYDPPTGAIELFIAWVKVTIKYTGQASSGTFLFALPDKNFVYEYGGTFTDDTSSASGEVYGATVTATYQSGWFQTGLPIEQYQMRELWIDKDADGDVTAYLYSDRSTTADDTITYSSTSDAAELEWPTPRTAGHDFSIKLETTADSCFLKGWGALIRNFGKRKD